MDLATRRKWALALVALLLPPAGYAMATQRFGLAGACAVAIIMVRWFLWPQRSSDAQDQSAVSNPDVQDPDELDS